MRGSQSPGDEPLCGHPGPAAASAGHRRAFEKEGLDPQEEALWAGRRPDESRWGEEPTERWGRLIISDSGQERPVPTEPGSYPQFYALLEGSLRRGGEPPVPASDAVAVLEVIEAAMESDRTGRAVSLI